MNFNVYQKIDFARRHAAACARAYNFSDGEAPSSPASAPSYPPVPSPVAPVSTPPPYAPAYPGTQPPNFVQRHPVGSIWSSIGVPTAGSLVTAGGLWMSNLPKWAKIGGTLALPFVTGYAAKKLAVDGVAPQLFSGVDMSDPAARKQFTAYLENLYHRPLTGTDMFTAQNGLTPEELANIQDWQKKRGMI